MGALLKAMTEPEPVEGCAIIYDGKILVRTISDTRRAAIVNWLVTEARIPIFINHTDDEIEELWHKHSGSAYVARVDISQALSDF